MCIGDILFVIAYHKGLNCKSMVYLDCVVENNYFTGEREISESLCCCGFITFRSPVQKGIPALHPKACIQGNQLCSPRFEELADVDCC